MTIGTPIAPIQLYVRNFSVRISSLRVRRGLNNQAGIERRLRRASDLVSFVRRSFTSFSFPRPRKSLGRTWEGIYCSENGYETSLEFDLLSKLLKRSISCRLYLVTVIGAFLKIWLGYSYSYSEMKKNVLELQTLHPSKLDSLELDFHFILFYKTVMTRWKGSHSPLFLHIPPLTV